MSLIDKFITEIDKGLKFSTHNYQKESRQYPAQNIDKDSLNELERSISASLMRINHAGEVSAQGLYRGQALTARLDGTREKMDEAAERNLIIWHGAIKDLKNLMRNQVFSILSGMDYLSPWGQLLAWLEISGVSVSYTHLTLPTKA